MKRGGSSKKPRQATGEEAAGSSQPYHECPFCKHGFTTHQALGGHMNIHRRDGTRRPSRDTLATGTASAPYPSAPPTGSNFVTYYSGEASAAADATSFGSASQSELNLFGGAATHNHDLRLGLGSRVPGEWEQPDSEAERSLDLELRLGRHPGWQ